MERSKRLARLLALASLAEHEAEVNPAAIAAALTGIREQLEAIKTLKSQLTSIGNATKAVWQGLDGLRSGHYRRALFLAKGSLFLGRMTQMADGISLILERNA